MPQQPRFEPYAILVADMIGYSRRLALHPLDTHAAFTRHLRHVFGPTVHDCSGQIVKTTGDGIVAIFKASDRAETCACGIQDRLSDGVEEVPPGAPIQYRIAVHYGRIVVENRDIFGLDVNAAIHMQSLAPPGGVCVSQVLFQRLPENAKARYQFVGQRHLKNLPEPVGIYTYGGNAAPLARPQARLPILTPPRRLLRPPPRLGLAQFQVYTEARPQEALARLAEDSLLCGLSRFNELFVVTPVGTGITQAGPAATRSRSALAKELAVEYLLYGSCVITSGTLVLTVHLELLARNELLWSNRLTIDLGRDLQRIDELISSQLTAGIVMHLERVERDSWGMRPESDDERLFREAKELMSHRTLQSFDQARQVLSKIVQRSGEIGDVYIALARAEHSYGLLLAGQQFVESLERARGYAKKAIEVDALSTRAHAELALQEMFLKRQDSAAEIYQHALRLNPYDPMLRADWADCLVLMGRAEEALPILKGVLDSWPRDRTWVEWNLCDAYWALSRPDQIVEILDRQPDQPHVHRFLAASNAKLGRMEQARRHADRVRLHQPSFSTRAWSEVVPYTNADSSAEYAEFLERAGL